MKKIDLHQDVILSFMSGREWFGDQTKVVDAQWTYAWNKIDYENTQCLLVWAANRPYQLIGDFRDLEKRVITYDREVMQKQHEAMERLIAQYHCNTIRNKQDLDAIETLSFLHHIEWVDHAVTEQEIEQRWRQWVRSIGFTWNFANYLATNNTSKATTWLTSLWKNIVKKMHDLGMIVDTAHMNHQSMMDVIRIAKKPIMNSHSNLKHFCAHTRNVEDEFLYALKDNGGVLWLSVYQDFVWWTHVDAYLEQIAYVIDLIGPDHVALWTDFHWLVTQKCLVWLQHISDLNALEDRVVELFWENIAQKFFWDNSMRVLQANL